MKARPNASLEQSKKKMLIITVIITVALAVLVFFILTNNAKTVNIIVAKTNIKSGDLITKEMLGMKEVGSYGRDSNLATQPEQVIGKYAVKDIASGEYIFGSSLTDDYMKRLSEKARYGAIAIPINLLDAVTADIKENDFVGIMVSMKKSGEETQMGYEDLPSTSTKLIYSDKLVSVRVLGVFDSSGNPTGDSSRRVREGNFSAPSMIVFDALPEQRVLLNQARDNGSIRLVIQPEHVQEAYREAWGLTEDGQTYAEDLDELLDDAERIEDQHDSITQQQKEEGQKVLDDIEEIDEKNQEEIEELFEDEDEVLDMDIDLNNIDDSGESD